MGNYPEEKRKSRSTDCSLQDHIEPNTETETKSIYELQKLKHKILEEISQMLGTNATPAQGNT